MSRLTVQYCQNCYSLVFESEAECSHCGARLDPGVLSPGATSPVVAPADVLPVPLPEPPEPPLEQPPEPPLEQPPGATSVHEELVPDTDILSERLHHGARYSPLDREEVEYQYEAAEATRVELALQRAVRWFSRLLFVAIVTALLTGVIKIIEERNREAKSRELVNAQLAEHLVQRRANLLKAADTLDALFQELQDPARAQAHEGGANAWKLSMRKRLGEVEADFKLDGNIHFTRQHAVAEQALGNACGYFHSLIKTWSPGEPLNTGLVRRMTESLVMARDDLQ